uniref:Uncharacterized protein n=1 Tax=Anguilla anguilla TaxID=7936 RepID=A0A0E9SLX5_ANGAN
MQGLKIANGKASLMELEEVTTANRSSTGSSGGTGG